MSLTDTWTEPTGSGPLGLRPMRPPDPEPLQPRDRVECKRDGTWYDSHSFGYIVGEIVYIDQPGDLLPSYGHALRALVRLETGESSSIKLSYLRRVTPESSWPFRPSRPTGWLAHGLHSLGEYEAATR